MEQIETYIELNKSENMRQAVIYETPIWIITLYVDYKKHLPFMADKESVYNNLNYRVGEVVVDDIGYSKKNSLAECKAAQRSFYQDGGRLYVHCDNDNPLWVYFSPRYSKIIGFSNGKQREIDGQIYYPGADIKQSLKQSADNLEYDKMKFNTARIDIANADGSFDKSIDFIGNNINIKYAIAPYTMAKSIMQYYINNAAIKTDRISFECKDKRERLSQKIPNEYFTGGDDGEYPKINTDLIGKIKQEAFGYCKGLPGVCVDRNDLYNPDGSIKTTRAYRFSSKITGNLEYIEIKQTQDMENPKGEQWTQLFNPIGIHSYDRANGIININAIACLPHLPNGVPKYDAEPYEVRATGIFNPESSPKDIIQALLYKYCEIPFDSQNYNVSEWNAELAALANIGIVFDKETDIFAAIEQIQNASARGFQVYYDYDKFSARLDDNNRAVSVNIEPSDILNINDIEINMNTDLYATTAQVEYARNYQAKTAEILIDNRNEKNLKNLFKIPKTYILKSGLKSKAEAQAAADNLIDFFKTIRPMINGIKLFGEAYFDLKLFDIVKIDLRIENKDGGIYKRLATAINYAENATFVLRDSAPQIDRNEVLELNRERENIRREFGGLIIGKIMNLSKNINEAVTEIDILYLRSA
ncbi:MAG: hypothetical protein LBH29_04490 [Elusimicrobiota bacterium]|jgi:hypothetical protein|nr:hypothetical protein [Elusimicrobiota bacterium]